MKSIKVLTYLIVFGITSQHIMCGIESNLKEYVIGKNISLLLDNFLKDYDKRVRPNYSGPPVEVGITININNINSVSEVNMDLSMDIYFRQYWIDERLAYKGPKELVIGADLLQQIWLPDTFIANDKSVYFHEATVKNKFIRIKPNGEVLYSIRLTVTSSCPMNFKNFPMDSQTCNLEIESYGFRTDDIVYRWRSHDETYNSETSALSISPDLILPEFQLRNHKLIDRQFTLSTGVYSRLTLKLNFVRNLGHYIIQIYLPSTLIVVLSWVSFWLDRTSAPARVALGITTVLTMLSLIWSTNDSLPKISYIKGIDVFLFFCFIMTFLTVIEYGLISYVHRYMERNKRILVRNSIKSGQNQLANTIKSTNPINHKNSITIKIEKELEHKLEQEETEMNPEEEFSMLNFKTSRVFFNNNETVKAMRLTLDLNKKASTIDNVSKFLFPTVFFLFHATYWAYYINIFLSHWKSNE